MPRQPRNTIENGLYHIMLRGNNKQKIFFNDKDFQKMTKILKKAKEKYNIKIFHYVFMNNHIHLLLESKTGETLSKFIKSLTVNYVNYFRKNYGGIGHFFQDRFKSFLIENEKYLLKCSRYIELNPVNKGIISNPEDYKWSSASFYLKNIPNEIVTYNPGLKSISKNKEECIKWFKNFLKRGIYERRSLDRYFKEGFYGTKETYNRLKKSGTFNFTWSHPGRPKNKDLSK